MNVAWQTRRARVAQESWNLQHPERPLPWEWVEEALLAWRDWKDKASYDAPAALDAKRRHEEFARRIPPAVYDEIFAPQER